MNYCTSCKIQCPKLPNEPAFRPDHVAKRLINKGHPKKHQQAERREFHSSGNCTADNRGCDHNKNHLVHRKEFRRDCRRIISVRFHCNAIHEPEIRPSKEPIDGWRKSRRITEGCPLHRRDSKKHDAHHQHVQHVLGPAHAAVIEPQGRRHQQDECHGDQHEPCITTVDPGFRLSEGNCRKCKQYACKAKYVANFSCHIHNPLSFRNSHIP